MDQKMISYKAAEYLGRAGSAEWLGKREKAKKSVLTLLILYRLQSRAASRELADKYEAFRALERSVRKAKDLGITFPMGEQRISELREEYRAADDRLAEIGESISLMLDTWQSMGATLEDLCNLCNRNPAQVQAEIKPSEKLFSEMVFVHNLDYKNPRDKGWIEAEVDAPLTHTVKAYWIYLMQNTQTGRNAAREAMKAVFPEVMENALTLVTDADGVQHLIDKDGVDLGTVGD